MAKRPPSRNLASTSESEAEWDYPHPFFHKDIVKNIKVKEGSL